MKYKNMKKVSHGFLYKYKTLLKLVYIMISEIISGNVHHVICSAVTNYFNTARNMLFISLDCVLDVLTFGRFANEHINL